MQSESEHQRVTEMLRLMYGEARDWYKVSEEKAKLLVTLDAIAVGAVSGLVISDPPEFRDFILAQSTSSLTLLILAALAFFGSIICAIVCVRSKIYTERQLTKIFRASADHAVDPSTVWFFQFHTRHRPDVVLGALQADSLAEARALLANLGALAQNVTRKHRVVNTGFLLTGTGMILFLSGTIFYAFHVNQ